ncbi:hypothetical protein [Iamia sp.]|uniref:hypothetical protein n=1 Tax=Iamia sp. TaxID=2722710 RepID=UPI002C03798F|nr:hypothetical protein [Iamia sp.]HXH56601.1 hypothetical protein [Iamia sp.]
MSTTKNQPMSAADLTTVMARQQETEAVSTDQTDGPKTDPTASHGANLDGAAETEGTAVEEANRQAALSPRDIDKLTVPTPHVLPEREEP